MRFIGVGPGLGLNLGLGRIFDPGLNLGRYVGW